MPFDVQIREEAERDLESFRAFEQNRILDTIEDQLNLSAECANSESKAACGIGSEVRAHTSGVEIEDRRRARVLPHRCCDSGCPSSGDPTQIAESNHGSNRMKTISLDAAQADLNSLVTDSQSGRVVIERNGRPSAVVVGIEDYDEEDLALASSDEFWQMIDNRRAPGRSASISEVRERLRTKQSG